MYTKSYYGKALVSFSMFYKALSTLKWAILSTYGYSYFPNFASTDDLNVFFETESSYYNVIGIG